MHRGDDAVTTIPCAGQSVRRGAAITPEQAAIIREEYYSANRGAAGRAAARAGLDPMRVCRYASRNGWTQRHEIWSEEEDDMLESLCDKSIQEIQAKLKKANRWGKQRSLVAIQKRLSKRGLCLIPPDHFTAQSASDLLGVQQSTVIRWVKKGWLHAIRENHRKYSDDPRHWKITRADLRKFMIENVAEWARSWARIDPFWLVDILLER